MPGADQKPTKPGSDLATVDRVHQVLQWVLLGHDEHAIGEAVAKMWPGQPSKPLITRAMMHLAKAGDADPATVRGWCIEATREIYRRAVDVGDMQTALRAIRQLAELTGDEP